MSKNFHFRGPFTKQHRKRAQTLLKSEREHFYHLYWSLPTKLSWKKSLLVIRKTLRQFVNTLTGGDKYSLLNRDILKQPIQMELSQKQKTFSAIFLSIFKISIKIWKFSKKRMTVIADAFSKLWTPKNGVR